MRRHPGAHLREIARSLSLPLGTALYHLDYLNQSDLVVVRRDGRYKRFFVKHMLGRLEKDYVSAFHHVVPRKVVTVLLAKGKRTQRELCEEIGVSRSTLSFHVNNLVEKGILKCDYRWPENHYSVADAEIAARILVKFRDTFADGATDRFDKLVSKIGASLAAYDEDADKSPADEDSPVAVAANHRTLTPAERVGVKGHIRTTRAWEPARSEPGA